jgi:hypothetical protein
MGDDQADSTPPNMVPQFTTAALSISIATLARLLIARGVLIEGDVLKAFDDLSAEMMKVEHGAGVAVGTVDNIRRHIAGEETPLS